MISIRAASHLSRHILVCLLCVSGCQSRFQNQPLGRYDPTGGYRFEAIDRGENNTDETFIFLAFSGGGTRAAAFAYGVLRGLSEIDNPSIQGASLLEEVDVISSVSGGSFTALAYGVWHEEIFNEHGFRKRFLDRNIMAGLLWHVLNPLNLFALPFPVLDNIDVASRYYDETVFLNHTYQDLIDKGRPYIIANSTDMSRQTTFSFVQPYFDLLGSDLSSIPVAWAAAASSAFPILLAPMRMRYCVNDAMKEAVNDALSTEVHSRLPTREAWAHSLLKNPGRTSNDPVEIDPKKHRYLYMLDGGLADNLGLHAFIDGTSIRGIRELINKGKVKKLLLVVVDAGKPPAKDYESKRAAPGRLASGLAAGTAGIYNNSLLMTKLVDHTLLETMPAIRLVYEACKAECPDAHLRKPPPIGMIDYYVAHVNFGTIARDRRRDFMKIKTNFSLPKQQVEDLIEEGRRQIKNDPQIRKMLIDLGG